MCCRDPDDPCILVILAVDRSDCILLFIIPAGSDGPADRFLHRKFQCDQSIIVDSLCIEFIHSKGNCKTIHVIVHRLIRFSDLRRGIMIQKAFIHRHGHLSFAQLCILFS